MRYIISLLLTSAALPVCAPALAEVPGVVTDIPPVHALVAQVMGDLGTPELLLDRGANAHSFQLRPSQAAALAEAGLVVWIGPEMTPWLERALDGVATTENQMSLITVAGTHVQGFGAAGDDHDHDPAKADPAPGDHAAENDDEHQDHDHDGTDPHVWLDPANAQVWLAAIAAELSRIDPDNAATYAANATAAHAGIAALDTELRAILAPVAGTPFVVFHDAYGYFTGHYGLTVAGSVALGDAAAPGAARLDALRHDLEDAKAVCIFPEAAHDPKLVAQLVDGTPVRIGGLLDPAGVQQDPGPDAYGGTLRALARTLADCLAGG
jgi:zinc transport system substrate-binding protein